MKPKIKEVKISFEEVEAQAPLKKFGRYPGWESYYLAQYLEDKGFDLTKPITRDEDTKTNKIIFRQK